MTFAFSRSSITARCARARGATFAVEKFATISSRYDRATLFRSGRLVCCTRSAMRNKASADAGSFGYVARRSAYAASAASVRPWRS